MQEQFALKNTTSYHYDEKRHLELLDQPWSGAGLLFASTDGTLIKLQLQPHRKIMAITPTEMIYFDPGAGRTASHAAGIWSSFESPGFDVPEIIAWQK